MENGSPVFYSPLHNMKYSFIIESCVFPHLPVTAYGYGVNCTIYCGVDNNFFFLKKNVPPLSCGSYMILVVCTSSIVAAGVNLCIFFNVTTNEKVDAR